MGLYCIHVFAFFPQSAFVWETPSCRCMWLRSIYFHCCVVVFHCINQLHLNQEFIYAFSCDWTFGLVLIFAMMYNAAINILLSVSWGTHANFYGGLNLGVEITSSESLHIFHLTGVAKLL